VNQISAFFLDYSCKVEGGYSGEGRGRETLQVKRCRNPTLGKVGECNSHSQKWKLGVLRDSQKLRRQFEGSNLLALMRSLYKWKALEA